METLKSPLSFWRLIYKKLLSLREANGRPPAPCYSYIYVLTVTARWVTRITDWHALTLPFS